VGGRGGHQRWRRFQAGRDDCLFFKLIHDDAF
jgi:hypothetical protein